MNSTKLQICTILLLIKINKKHDTLMIVDFVNSFMLFTSISFNKVKFI